MGHYDSCRGYLPCGHHETRNCSCGQQRSAERERVIKRLISEGIKPLAAGAPTAIHHFVQDETQHTIDTWARSTFGPSTALERAVRMNIEVTELLQDLSSSTQDGLLAHLIKSNMQLAEALCARVSELAAKGQVGAGTKAQGKECPDVQVMLYQVAEACGIALLNETDRKMQVNRKRKWTKLVTGRHQHG